MNNPLNIILYDKVFLRIKKNLFYTFQCKISVSKIRTVYETSIYNIRLSRVIIIY